MERRFDVIIIGLGVMGAAAAREASKRGRRALGLDRFDVPNAMGSSHGRTRIFRTAYFEHPGYVPLLQRAREGWNALEAESKTDLFARTGALWLGREAGNLVGGSRRAAIEHGLPHEMLSRSDITRRYLQFQLEDNDFVGFFEPDAGALFAEKCIRAFTESATKNGAAIHTSERVKSWTSNGSTVSVETSRGVYRGESLVITAGPWTASLAQGFGPPLVVSRQATAWFHEIQPRRFDAAHFPVWAYEQPDGAFFYGFPHFRHDPGLKIALHKEGEACDPDTVERRARRDEIDLLDQALARILPDAHGPLASSSVCLYTNSPDGHFIIDRHPAHANVAVAAGFSGHGFKFAPVVGEVLCDIALGSSRAGAPPFLSLGRFAAISAAETAR